MHIEEIDPFDIDDGLAEQLADIATRNEQADEPAATYRSADGLRLGLQYGNDNHPTDRLWLAVADSGEPVGFANLDLSRWDNPQLAFVGCCVDPDLRGQGIGTALLERQLATVKELGRSVAMNWLTAGGAAQRLLAEHGFTVGQNGVGRRINPQQCDPAKLRALVDAAEAHARDYEIVRLEGPAPDDMLPVLTAVFEAINDAPLEDLDFEPDVFTPERLRDYDEGRVRVRQRVYRMLAHHKPSGQWAGHTILCVDETRPGFAFQEDTTVVRAHRGHRLGLLLKASMLLWIREARPEIETIDTWNAASNEHMIAVNEQIGCYVAQRGVGMQLSL